MHGAGAGALETRWNQQVQASQVYDIIAAAAAIIITSYHIALHRITS